MLSLDIAIATHKAEGIMRLAARSLPHVEGVRYVVSWQAHGNIEVPAELDRDDVKIIRFDAHGQSANRNNAMAHCTADVVLVSDDDVTYYPEGIKTLMEIFATSPRLDVATFRTRHGDMSRYPDRSFRIRERYPKNYYVGAIDIAFRRRRIGHLRFCEEFGFGSPKLHGGEDEIFLYSAVKRGLECRYFPVTIGRHPEESTGVKMAPTPSNIRANGCVMALMYPWTSVMRIPLKAWRLWKSGRSEFWYSLKYLAQGAWMAPAVLERNRKVMWGH